MFVVLKFKRNITLQLKNYKRMKKIALLLTILIGINCFGQENETKNIFSFGTNFSFYGHGDIVGPSIYGEYSYELNKHFSISPKLASGYAHRVRDKYFGSLSSFAVSLSVDYTPFPERFDNLKIDFGGLYHKVLISSVNMINTEYESADVFNFNYYGFLSSVKLDVIDLKKIKAGLRFDVLYSIKGLVEVESWQVGPYIGIKF